MLRFMGATVATFVPPPLCITSLSVAPRRLAICSCSHTSLCCGGLGENEVAQHDHGGPRGIAPLTSKDTTD